jgi:glycosyltransferase involved in cell wall biosynthesis
VKTPIRVLGLVPYPLGQTPSQRYRIEQWQPRLKQEGIELDLRPFADSRLMSLLHKPGRLSGKFSSVAGAFVRRALDVTAVRRYDAVFIHRAVCLAGPAILERAIGSMRKPVIFDFDDAIYFLHTTAANRFFGWLKFPGKTAAICRLSAQVVVGNSYLADYARQYNRSVTIVPSSVDTECYRPSKKPAAKGPVVIGWMGSSTSQTHLEAFAPVLRNLCARRGIVLRVVSDREPELPGVAFEWRRWSAETEVAELAGFDIGIMPMPDDQWARGKSAMKALLYMAMGVPVICSAVGTNCEVISHGENGLLAASPKEWLEHLGLLAGCPAERERLGAAGRRTVEEEYSMTRCASRFARVVEEAVAVRRTVEGYELPETQIMRE